MWRISDSRWSVKLWSIRPRLRRTPTFCSGWSISPIGVTRSSIIEANALVAIGIKFMPCWLQSLGVLFLMMDATSCSPNDNGMRYSFQLSWNLEVIAFNRTSPPIWKRRMTSLSWLTAFWLLGIRMFSSASTRFGESEVCRLLFSFVGVNNLWLLSVAAATSISLVTLIRQFSRSSLGVTN